MFKHLARLRQSAAVSLSNVTIHQIGGCRTGFIVWSPQKVNEYFLEKCRAHTTVQYVWSPEIGDLLICCD